MMQAPKAGAHAPLQAESGANEKLHLIVCTHSTSPFCDDLFFSQLLVIFSLLDRNADAATNAESHRLLRTI